MQNSIETYGSLCIELGPPVIKPASFLPPPPKKKNAPLRPLPLSNKPAAQMELPLVKIKDKFSHTYIKKKRMMNFVLFHRERKHIPPSSRYVV